MRINLGKIEVEEIEKDPWTFRVRVGEGEGQTEHKVILSKSYYDDLTGVKITPEELIRNSFEFLLEREPKESILKKFHLPEIQQYFPEYEEEIRRWK